MSGKRVNLSEKVYGFIIEDIFTGKLELGTKISEEQLSQLYKVSRTPIREAVRKLSVQGIIHCKPRSHIEIVNPSHEEKMQILEVEASMAAFNCRNLDAEKLKQNQQQLSALSASRRKAYIERDIIEALRNDIDQIQLFFACSANCTVEEIFTYIF